jgi:nitroimidazol reductase NimA-like FMN-containing flavoprotein (pyridoxamine 5'-phosphate oxidase superfamily)
MPGLITGSERVCPGRDWIATGHLALLETAHEFARELESCGSDQDIEEAARGAEAFLRHSLLPFATAEQAFLADDVHGDSAALDHAFLAIEIDKLSALIREIGPEDLPGRLLRLRRAVYRIEVILELHAEREEAHTQSPPARVPVGHAVSSIGEGEIAGFLRAQDWGVLAVNGPAGPYAVPVSFGLSGGSIVIASGPGQKLAALEADGRACLTVCSIRNGADWTCVVAQGRMVPVKDVLGRARALHAIARGRVAATLSSLRRASAAAVFRMDAVEVSGRTRK